ncbi:hypothetical protein GCM10022255_050800 [Dactylosporangium darangshiense]|uniref:DUF2267 domain-containing protein n=2 Tax=Dactylosporangium darangshiense TaxID=579108 RepID=A0ABP8DCM4_9ACTN
MQYPDFMRAVAERMGDASAERTRAVTTAALRTLAGRVPGGEARDLAAQLPKELQEPLLTPGVPERAERYDVQGFVHRVAARADVNFTVAREGARAVLLTLREAVSPGEFEAVRRQLTDDYGELLTPEPAAS